MKTTGFLSRSTRFDKSIAELEAEFAAKRIAPMKIADEFIDTTDSASFEEHLAQLSPGMRTLIEHTAKLNVLVFDAIIEETIERRGYTGGWIALRDWTRRQPWLDEAVEEAKPFHGQTLPSAEEIAAAARALSEQGHILGILRVERMRATSDEERDTLTKQIEELEASFAKANRDALDP